MSFEINENDPYGIADVQLRTDLLGTNSEIWIQDKPRNVSSLSIKSGLSAEEKEREKSAEAKRKIR